MDIEDQASLEAATEHVKTAYGVSEIPQELEAVYSCAGLVAPRRRSTKGAVQV